MPRVSNAFEDYTSIMLERNAINVHSNTRPQPALQKWELDGRTGDFGNFF